MSVATQIRSTRPLPSDLQMAEVCFRAGNFDEAIRLTAKPTENATGFDEYFRLQLRSVAQSEKGLYKAALKTLNEAAPFVDDLGPRENSKFYGQRAFLHTRLKEYNDALVDLAGAKDFAIESGDADAVARARNNLARHYRYAERFDEAVVEVDAAIEYAQDSDDSVLLGRFLDQKAGILAACGRFDESMVCSKKAMDLLADHPSLLEARVTYGRTLIMVGATYLAQPDPFATVREYRAAIKLLPIKLDKETVTLALDRSDGNVSAAADELGIFHSALLKAIKKFNLSTLQKRKHERKYKKALIEK